MTRIQFILIVAIMVAQGQPSTADLNEDFESKVYEIYLNYHSSPTPEDQWMMLVGDRQSQNYEIQAGDNLWTISQVLFGDGHYWPKIWSINSEISNPHRIEIGDVLRFAPGTSMSPPAFTVSSKNNFDNFTANEFSRDLPIELPPPLITSSPLLKDLPPSLPTWSAEGPKLEDEQEGVSVLRKKFVVTTPDELVIKAFMTDQVLPQAGRVIEVEGLSAMGTRFQYLLVGVKKNKFKANDRLLVFQANGQQPVLDSVQGKRGFVNMLSAVVRLTEQVSEIKIEDSEEVFRAQIEESYLPVLSGHILSEGKVELASMKKSPPNSFIKAQVTGGAQNSNQKVYGIQDFIFLDKGQTDGLKTGDVLQVFRNNRQRSKKHLIDQTHYSIGLIRIVKLDAGVSTAVVLFNSDDIRAGDFTGKALVSDSNPNLIDGAVSSAMIGSSEESSDFDLEEVDQQSNEDFEIQDEQLNIETEEADFLENTL